MLVDDVGARGLPAQRRGSAAAGHDRGVIPIRREHLDAWLNPDPDNLAGQYRILDDREDIRYVYEEAG